MKLADKIGFIPRIADNGMKQWSYVGNVAYAHVLAIKVIQKEPKKLGGLPITITDDTPIMDSVRFCQRMSRELDSVKLKPSW